MNFASMIASPPPATVLIRAQTIEMLSREFGPPESGKNYERWVIQPPAPHQPVHIIVNAPMARDRAHVLVFDPSAANGQQVLEMGIHAIEEVVSLIEHLKQSISPRLKHVATVEHQEIF